MNSDFEAELFPVELYMGRLSLIMLRHSIDVLFHVEPKDSSLSVKMGGYTGRVFYIHKNAEEVRKIEQGNPLDLATNDAEEILARFKREIN